MLPGNLVQDVVNLCDSAGDAIMAIYNDIGGFDVAHKADDSPLTAADMEAHKILLQGLDSLLPGVPVLSEESLIPEFDIRRQWQRYWLVDPLDGTKEFIHRNNEFTVNVALIDKGEPVLGVVHVPATGVIYTGQKAEGAYKITEGKTEKIRTRRVASRLDANAPIEIVVSRRHGTVAVDQLILELRQHFPAVTTKSMGSSLKLCLIAEGEADLYPRLAPTCEWDTAAAQAVVEAAGGGVVGQHFDSLRYNQKKDLVNACFYGMGDPAFGWRALLSRANTKG